MNTDMYDPTLPRDAGSARFYRALCFAITYEIWPGFTHLPGMDGRPTRPMDERGRRLVAKAREVNARLDSGVPLSDVERDEGMQRKSLYNLIIKARAYDPSIPTHHFQKVRTVYRNPKESQP